MDTPYVLKQRKSKMSDYAILRVKKIKTVSAMSNALSHNSRSKKVINVDEKKSIDNKNYVSESFGNIDFFNSKLPKKRRKDAVLGIEVMATASPDFWKDMNKMDIDFWVQDNFQWMKEKFGEENILRFDLHMDETSPHIHAVIIPLENEKLNAKKILGGPKEMSAMQDSYYKKIAMDIEGLQKRKLSRGIKGSKAKHTTIKQYYSAMNKLLPDIPKKQSPVDFGYKKRLEQWSNEVLGKAKLSEILQQDNGNFNKSNSVLKNEKAKVSAINKSLKQQSHTSKQNLDKLTNSLWEINSSKFKDKNSMIKAIINHKSPKKSKGREI